MTASKERRQEVLALAREHNFLILEGAFPFSTGYDERVR